MKLISIFTTIALTAAPAAWAGSLSVTPSEPMMEPMAEVAPAPYDWTGFYAGLSAGKTTGGFDITEDGAPPVLLPFDLDGRSLGGFAGYNFQRGSMVYGLELALQDVDANLEFGGIAIPEAHYNYIHDLKARIGFANNNILFYAFGGYSLGQFEIEGDAPGAGKYDANGPNMGLGVDMAFRENWLVGLEYIRRSLDGDFGPAFPTDTFDSDVDTLQLRVGYKF